MTLCLGTVPAGSTLYIPFTTYAGSTGASATCTGLAVTDIEIYKNGSTTQRASDAGYALLDTDGIDFDGVTGLHGFSLDLSDNTDAGFFAVGSWYWVVVSAIPVDAQTVTFLAAIFRIGPTEVVTGYPVVDSGAISGSSSAADRLELSTLQIVPGTVNDANTTPSATVFAASDITTATAEHYTGRVVIFTSGDLMYQARPITAYALDTGEGKFTCDAFTSAPSDGDTFIIV